MNDHDLRCFAIDCALRSPFYEMTPVEVQEALLSRAKAIYAFVSDTKPVESPTRAKWQARRGVKR